MVRENYRLTFQKRLAHLEPVHDEDICRIIASCDATADLHLIRDVIRMIANLGLKDRELADIRWSDINCEGKWVIVGRNSKVGAPGRWLPLRPRALAAIMSVRAGEPECDFVFGPRPVELIGSAVKRIAALSPSLTRGSLTTKSIRLNYVVRLMSSGIPKSIIKYCLGQCDESALLRHSSLTPQVKHEILRRDLESFLPEF
jgi:integrase